MTGPTPAMRNAAHVEVMRLDSVRDIRAAQEWLRGHDVRAGVYRVCVDIRVLRIHGRDGTRMVARLGQWLTYEPHSGEFAVYDDEHYRQQHTPVHVDCWCGTCEDIVLTARTMNGDPTAMFDRRFIVCGQCGNKRCPRAWHHDNDCTGSNEPGQTVTRNGVAISG